MAYIKKLKDNELIGGTDNTDVYPVTSTEAVYNKENVSQEYINNHVDGSKIVNGTITNSKIANGAVSVGKLNNEVQTLIQRGADSSWTPMGDYDVDALYYANDLVFDPETNSSYLSLRADNMGHPVTDEMWWMKVLDGSYVNLLEEELQQLVESISEGTQQQVEELNEALEALEAQADQSRQDIQDIVNSLAVVQTTGQSTSAVMSQKAVSDLPFIANGYDVNESGFSVADANRDIGLRYDNNGLDAGKLNPHFVELLKSEGVAVDCIASVEEDGLYVVDGTLNVGVKVDNDGIHSENVLEFLTINY